MPNIETTSVAADGKPIVSMKVIDKDSGTETPVNVSTCTEAVTCKEGKTMQQHLEALYDHANNEGAHLTANEKAGLETQAGAQAKATAAKNEAVSAASLLVENAKTTASKDATAKANAARDAAFKYADKIGENLTTHEENKSNPHGVTAAQVGLGNVPNKATNDTQPTYTVSSTLSALTSGERMAVAFGKIAKAISDYISHKSNKNNPHSVTATQVGAAPSGFGLGSAAATVVSDLNTADKNGFYQWEPGAINVPPVLLNSGGSLIVLSKGASYKIHIAFNNASNPPIMFLRTKCAGVWSDWIKIHSSADVVPIVNGGTGASTAQGARSALGITLANLGAAAVSHNHNASNITDGTLSSDRLPTVPVAKGGTGATTAAAALAALGAAASSHKHSVLDMTSGTLPIDRGGTGGSTAAAARNALGITPANIGAATAGLNDYYSVTSDTDMDAKIASIYEAMPAYTSKFITINVNGFVRCAYIWKSNNDYGIAELKSYSGLQSYQQKTRSGGTWGSWTSLYPYVYSMGALNTEVSTPERWQGKTVYTKIISCGNIPSNGSKSVAHGAAAKQILRACGQASNGLAFPVGTPGFYYIGLRVGLENIELYSDTNAYSSNTATVQIWYTKV